MSEIAFTCNNLTFNGRNFYVKKKKKEEEVVDFIQCGILRIRLPLRFYVKSTHY